MSDTVIAVENLSKRYLIGKAERRHETLAGSLASALRAPLRNARNLARLDASRVAADAPDILWALRDVSFEVKRGEVLGIIGRNGAGKSTLLKILSRITEPTSGWVGIKGRVASLLEVGTGFHQELTGRDNVYMNGTLLGMTKREIDQKFDEIVEFSGVERFLDTPVKRYSSGMQVRLAFAVAAHLDPEILVIDEVLAVGDAVFQKKCLGKMKEVASGESGRTVLFVSHDMTAVRSLCRRVMLLDRGACVREGRADRIIDSYLEHEEGIPSSRYSRPALLPSFGILSAAVSATDAATSDLPSDQSFIFDVHCSVLFSRQPAYLRIEIVNKNGQILCILVSENLSNYSASGDNIYFRCRVPPLNLNVGRYGVRLTLRTSQGVIESLDPAFLFDVSKGSTGNQGRFSGNGILSVPQAWEVS